MPKWTKITLFSFSMIGLLILFIWVSNKDQNRLLLKPEISIHVDGNNAFLTEEELYSRLSVKHLVYENQKSSDLPIESIERYVNEMTEVKTARVYKNHGGKWQIDVVLKCPIARVFDVKNNSYYLDKEGDVIKRSSLHTARVILFNGNIKDPVPDNKLGLIINNDSLKSIRILDDIYRISNYVCNSPFFQALIGQVYVDAKNEFILIPVLGNQKIRFGSAESEKVVADKFKRIEVFYEEAMPFEGWDKYSEISVKYNGQIVCKKR